MDIKISLLENFDSPKRLDEWIDLFKNLQRQYGKFAVLCLDVGYNNISGEIIPTKKQKC